jgi:hypothetical protein
LWDNRIAGLVENKGMLLYSIICTNQNNLHR